MISNETLSELEKPNRSIAYILGTRMCKVNEIRRDLLSRPGLCKEVCPEVKASKDPAPLKAKEVSINGSCYIVCSSTTQARKDALDRRALIESLKEKLKRDPKILIGNEGYRKYHKVHRGSTTINEDKIELDSRFDGKRVLKTNTGLSADQVAIK